MRLYAEIDSQQAKGAEQAVTLNNLIKYGPNPPLPGSYPKHSQLSDEYTDDGEDSDAE